MIHVPCLLTGRTNEPQVLENIPLKGKASFLLLFSRRVSSDSLRPQGLLHTRLLCLLLLLLFLIFPRIRVFSSALALGIRWPVCNLKSAFLYIMSFEPHNFIIRQKRQERLSVPILAKRKKSVTREVD